MPIAAVFKFDLVDCSLEHQQYRSQVVCLPHSSHAKDIIATIQTIEGVICDRSHFFAFEDSSLNFETVYYVPTKDYTVYMDTQQEIYLKLFRAFKEAGINFAYPTQLVYIKAGASRTVETVVVPPPQITK